MKTEIRPFLMFEGRAQEAMDFYMSLFPGSAIIEMKRYGARQPGPEGSIMHAVFQIAGQAIHCSDSFIHHDFTFTPALSLFVDCESEEQLRRVFAALSDGGATLMPLDDYGFSRQFGWVNDRFGVSWQVNLPFE